MTEASSGANTPDPLSPGVLERVEDIVVQTRPSSPQVGGGVDQSVFWPVCLFFLGWLVYLQDGWSVFRVVGLFLRLLVCGLFTDSGFVFSSGLSVFQPVGRVDFKSVCF